MITNQLTFPSTTPEILVIALGPQHLEIKRPFGAITARHGKITDVAVSPDGTVYVLTRRDHYVDPVNDCVHVLSPTGAYLGSFGGERIIDAHKIVCDPSGNLWVVNRDVHEIVAFDSQGTELRTLGTRHAPGRPFNHPCDLAFGADGSIWVADGYAAGHIHKFNAAGDLLLTAGSVGRAPGQFMTPHGIGILSDGRPVVADRENGRVQLFGSDGTFQACWDHFYRPSSIWIDGDDVIHIVDAIPTLTTMSADGTILGRCRPSANGPHGMDGHSDGSIYLAETNPHRISLLTPVSR